MLTYVCAFLDCRRRTIIDGHRPNCHKRFCLTHNQTIFHACPPPDEPFDHLICYYALEEASDRLQSVVDGLNIFERAQKLRPDHLILNPGKIDVRSLPSGAYNVNISLKFSDGVEWLARIHRVGFVTSDPRHIARIITQGEIDILRWLKYVAVAPVAEVKSDILSHGGTDFYFQEFLPGKPYEYDFFTTIPAFQLETTITELAKIFIRISNHPFQLIGSLKKDETSDTWAVGPYINVWAAKDDPPHFPGPFKTAGEKWATICDGYIRAIRSGSLRRREPAAAFIIYSWISQSILAYPPFNVEGEATYVMHEDFKWDVIMADESGHICGLLDWEWASIAPRCEAFAAPFGLMDKDAIFSTSHNRLSLAERQLADTYKSLGRPDLARCVEGGKVYQRLNWIFSDGQPALPQYIQLKLLGETMGMKMPEAEEE